jgi:hypothetical protein
MQAGLPTEQPAGLLSSLNIPAETGRTSFFIDSALLSSLYFG